MNKQKQMTPPTTTVIDLALAEAFLIDSRLTGVRTEGQYYEDVDYGDVAWD